jgi:two-component system sensor histidine kinase QseC
VAPVLAGVPLLLVLLALLVRYALRPLSELARLIERRQAESLAPIELGRNPKETVPIVAALNGLLERVRAALERERRFTADAAHELRTPLTALKVHAQNAVRASSEDERQSSLKLMLEGLERAIRLAEQMLALSRAAAARAPLGSESVPLREVVEEALEDVLPLVRSRGQRVALTSDPPVAEPLVRGERDKLVTAARNLLDNASRYAPEGCTLRIELKHEARHASFSVVDPGPGIPSALRQRVFESYYRIPGSRSGGSGLGLAIVREITAQHAGTVEIGDGDDGRGTRVTLRLPADAN